LLGKLIFYHHTMEVQVVLSHGITLSKC